MTEKPPRTLLSFAAVGGIGFVIEAIILTLLTNAAGWAPWLARIPSFLTAVLVTWALNRRHTFAGRGRGDRSLEAFFYTIIQGGGAIVNLAIFAACLAMAPRLHQIPVVALGIGAVGGFVFNFITSSRVLYARRRDHGK